MINEFKLDNGITNFTRMMFEATGWYKINVLWTHTAYFGSGQGCSFLNNACVSLINY